MVGAHIAGIPVEETVAALLPAAAAVSAALAAFVGGRLRRPRLRHRRLPR